MGIAAFQRFSGLITLPAFLSVIAASAIVAAATGSPAGALAGALASLGIAFVSLPHHPWIVAAASLTYSFYLLHEPIGSRAVSLVSRMGSGMLVNLVALAAGIGSSLVAAWLLFILVERPALIWASRIRYTGASPSPAPPDAGG
jgi:peptidoglycan/LPS O-acetylase OafA/YrhL